MTLDMNNLQKKKIEMSVSGKKLLKDTVLEIGKYETRN